MLPRNRQQPLAFAECVSSTSTLTHIPVKGVAPTSAATSVLAPINTPIQKVDHHAATSSSSLVVDHRFFLVSLSRAYTVAFHSFFVPPHSASHSLREDFHVSAHFLLHYHPSLWPLYKHHRSPLKIDKIQPTSSTHPRSLVSTPLQALFRDKERYYCESSTLAVQPSASSSIHHIFAILLSSIDKSCLPLPSSGKTKAVAEERNSSSSGY